MTYRRGMRVILDGKRDAMVLWRQGKTVAVAAFENGRMIKLTGKRQQQRIRKGMIAQ